MAQHLITLSPCSKRGAGVGQWQWGPLVISHTTACRGHIGRNTLKIKSKPWRYSVFVKSQTCLWCWTLILSIHESRNHGVEAGVAPNTFTPKESLGDLSPGPAKLEGLFPRGGTCFAGNTARVPKNYQIQVRADSRALWILCQKVRGGVTIMARVMDPGILEEAEWPLQNGSMEELCVDPRWPAWVPPGTSSLHRNCGWRSTVIPDRGGLTPLKNECLHPTTS